MDNTVDTFTPLIGARFSLSRDAEAALEAELVEVRGLDIPSRGEHEMNPFALLFRVGDSQVAAEDAQQGLFDVTWQDAGPVAMFLVPVESDEKGVYFEAIFN